LEAELAATKRAMELVRGVVPPKARYAAIKQMAAEGHSVQRCCRILDVAESGYYEWLTRAPSARAVRHALLIDVIRDVHIASHGTYGARRVTAELVLDRNVAVGHGQVEALMARASLKRVAGRPKWRRSAPDNRPIDLVNRQFGRDRINALWVTDIERHEALLSHAVVEGHRHRPVAAGRLRLGAA
jgi:putative transposase